jgi:hypothetical protein
MGSVRSARAPRADRGPDAGDLLAHERRSEVADDNAKDPAGGLEQRIEQAAVPVWGQELQGFQRERAADHDGDDKKQAVGIAPRERQPHERKRRKMLKVGVGHDRAVPERGNRCKGDESQRQPGGDTEQSLDHGQLC